ncbi:hypothetical protein BS78_04G064700 [Paspalum vaginatum]|nr:hypothetical protein BS78_04G064700 [Paspalum vaginatum]
MLAQAPPVVLHGCRHHLGKERAPRQPSTADPAWGMPDLPTRCQIHATRAVGRAPSPWPATVALEQQGRRCGGLISFFPNNLHTQKVQ